MYTYIVVDDEKLIRKGTIKKLEPMENLRCVGEAGNGRQAMELIEQADPDIIITDMNMPVMDGTELLPELTARYGGKHIIVISGYKDFEYMKHAIWATAVDYLLKPFSRDALQASVRKAIGNIESNAAMQSQIVSSEEEAEYARYAYDIQMLRSLITGSQAGEVALTSQKLAGMNRSHNYIVITMHSSGSFSHETFEGYLAENGFGDLALYLPHGTNSHIALFILFVPEQSVLNHQSFCLQIMESLTELHRSMEMDISFGVSSLQGDLCSLHTAFLETVKALNSRALHVEKNYCFYTEGSDTPVSIHWDRSEELLFRMEAGMADEMDRLLRELFCFFGALPGCTLSSVKFYCYQLAGRAKVIMNTYFEQINPEAVSTSMQNILNTVFSLGEIESYYSQFFTNICELLREKSVYAIDDTAEKIKIYVRRNYNKNISMDVIAPLFYLSRSYCSHLFKERTGENFVDFVNAVRIDKAKQLIRETDKKMYQIARLVGYDNVKYFFRVFKSRTGATPEEYRAATR